MSEQHDGGQAYPAAWGNHEQGGDYVPGMTLRDYFAGQALAGYVSTYTADEILDPELIAGHTYELADAMLRARAAKEGKGDE